MTLAVVEISTERRRLSGRTEPRGTQTGFPTWGAYVFGSVFVVVGTLIVLVGTRVIPVKQSDVHAPWWVLTVMGVVFALAGLGVWGMATRQYRAERRRREAERRYTGEPAFADYAWDTAGFAVPRWSRAIKGLAGAAGLSLFLSIFNYWAFGTKSPWMVKAVTLLFDLILVAVWFEAFLRLGRAVKFGGARVEFARFPYRLGEPVVARWCPAAAVVSARDGTFTLRCVEEWYEHRGSRKNRSAHLVQQEVWSATARLAAKTFTPGETVELRFEPPADAPPTQLSAGKPTFWELEVKLDLPGLNFQELYLVPVYAGR